MVIPAPGVWSIRRGAYLQGIGYWICIYNHIENWKTPEKDVTGWHVARPENVNLGLKVSPIREKGLGGCACF